MSDFTPIPATDAQHVTIRKLLRAAEFDTTTVTFMHRRLGVAEHEIGRPVQEWLDSLSLEQASVTIGKLQKMIED